jgi:hypothetical protein
MIRRWGWVAVVMAINAGLILAAPRTPVRVKPDPEPRPLVRLVVIEREFPPQDWSKATSELADPEQCEIIVRRIIESGDMRTAECGEIDANGLNTASVSLDGALGYVDWLIVRRIIDSWDMRTAECGEPITAQEAYAIGLATRMYRIAADAIKA